MSTPKAAAKPRLQAARPPVGPGIAGPGRPKGSKNKFQIGLKESVEKICHDTGVDPIRALCQFTLGRIPCAMCMEGKIKLKRRCRWCQGTGMQPVRPSLRLQANIRLADSVSPRLKSVTLGTVDPGKAATSTLAELMEAYAAEVAAQRAKGLPPAPAIHLNGHTNGKANGKTHIIDVQSFEEQ